MNESLAIKKLAIEHTAGFTKGALPEMEFSPAVNIIYGPNASGKSTTARIIQALLWPNDLSSDDLFVRAEVTLAAQLCRLQLIGKKRSESSDIKMPEIGDARHSQRYMLAQHELIAANEQGESFVKSIINEAHGNINLTEIANQLGYATLTRSNAAAKSLADKASKVKEAKKRETATTADEQLIAELDEKIAAAQAAQQTAQQIKQLQDFRYKQLLVTEKQADFDALPTALANILADDDVTLKEYSVQLTDLQQKQSQENANLAGFEKTLAELNITDSQQMTQDIAALRVIEAALQSIESLMQDAEKAATRARQESERKLVNLAGIPPLSAATNLPANTIARLESLAQKTGLNLAQLTALKEQLNWLTSTFSDMPAYSGEQITAGLQYLRQWLLAPDNIADDSRRPLAGAVFAGIATLLSAILALQQQSALGWLAAIAALAAVITFLIRKNNVSVPTKANWQEKYQQLPLSTLQSWDEKNVQQQVSRLQQELSNISYRQNALNKQRELQQKEIELAELSQKCTEEREAFLAEFGLPLPDYVATGENTLLYYLKDIIDWQKSSNELAITEGEIARLSQLLMIEVNNANGILSARSYQNIHRSIELKKVIDELDNKLQDYRQLTSTIKSNKQQIEQLDIRWKEKNLTRNTLFARLKLGTELSQVQLLLAQFIPQLENYQLVRQQLQDAQAVLVAIQHTTLTICAELTELTDDELAQKLAAYQQVAAQLSALSTEKGECQQRIANAKAANDCERLQAELAAEYDQLEGKLLTSAQAVTGYELVNMLKREVMASSMPAVMQRACVLFANFTTGRYQLSISDDQQHFTAYDSQEEKEQQLDQLSSGTRVQLLIAVRLAFVELQEQWLQLPLIFDEALASSDPVREEAIINTALTLASSGRQLFYFTNKPEEATLWVTRAQEKQVDFRRIDLPGQPTSRNIPRPPTEEIADGTNITHEEYGQLLNVAALSYQQGFANAHIWYIIEDNELIKKLLQADIAACRQLANPAFAPVIDSLIGSDAGRRARLLAGLLDQLESRWQLGHPLPFSALALEASGVLTSDNYRNGITALAEAENWNINEIIDKLNNKAVSRFTSAHTDRLKEYCLENGYYCDIAPLENTELHRQLLSDAQIAIDHDEITTDEINHLADRILY